MPVLERRHVRFGKTPSQARLWTLGSDERNARRVAETIPREDLVVGPAVLDRLDPH